MSSIPSSSGICDNCNTKFFSTNRSVAYCKSCYKERSRDICELVGIGNTLSSTSSNSNDSGKPNQVSLIITKNNVDQLENLIGSKEILIRLDLHGVLDTLSHDVEFPCPETICCISFVGSTTETRIQARKEMIKRLGKQILYGVLVFARGKSKNKNTFYNIGGKAWINSIIPTNKKFKSVFVDDSIDHYMSTKNKNIDNLDVCLFGDEHYHNNVYKIINSYYDDANRMKEDLHLKSSQSLLRNHESSQFAPDPSSLPPSETKV